MNRKEYKERLNNHIEYNGSDYMYNNEISELRHEVKNSGVILQGFNGRACIKPVKGGYILQSYYTDVASYIDGEFVKMWVGYSATTLKHINIFRSAMGLNPISKYEWVMMESIG